MVSGTGFAPFRGPQRDPQPWVTFTRREGGCPLGVRVCPQPGICPLEVAVPARKSYWAQWLSWGPRPGGSSLGPCSLSSAVRDLPPGRDPQVLFCASGNRDF